MRMMVMEFDPPRTLSGPKAGVLAGARLTVATKRGMPVGYWEDDRLSGGDQHRLATPGMVVVEVRTEQLYVIDADGEAHYLGLRLPERVGAELEQQPAEEFSLGDQYP